MTLVLKSFLQNSLSKLFPTAISVFIYRVIFSFVKKSFLDLGNLNIWYRNSLTTGEIKFGLSDIDITILSEKRADHPKIITHYKKNKKWNKVLGELNLYSQDDLSFLEKVFNSLELDRDPVLREMISLDSGVDLSAEKFIFLLKMMKNDFHNLLERPKKRRDKWFRHLEVTGTRQFLEERELSYINLIEILSHIKVLNEDEKACIEEVLIAEYRHEDINTIFEKSNYKEQYIYLFTEIWMGASIANNFFDVQLYSLNNLGASEKELLKANINWEIVGLYTQIGQADKGITLFHIDTLLRVVEKLENENQLGVLQRIKTILC